MYPGGVQVKTAAVFSCVSADPGRWIYVKDYERDLLFFPQNSLCSKTY